MVTREQSHTLFDSHAHLIASDPLRYPTAPLSGTLRTGDLDDPMTAERLVREMDALGVSAAAAVQRGHVYGFDNSYICDAAAAHPQRLRAVCSIDGRDPRCGDRVRFWVNERGAAGIRLMEPFKGADTSWFAGDDALAAWRAAADLGVPVCVHFFRWNRLAGLPALHRLLQTFRAVTVVVDHFSNMEWENGAPDYGMDDAFLAVADLPGVRTKFTTIPLGQIDDAGADAAPILSRAVQAFGAERVMWGSDIAQSKGSYESMVELGLRATRSLTGPQRRWVLHDTAHATYGDGHG